MLRASTSDWTRAHFSALTKRMCEAPWMLHPPRPHRPRSPAAVHASSAIHAHPSSIVRCAVCCRFLLHAEGACFKVSQTEGLTKPFTWPQWFIFCLYLFSHA
jgi:hypothetical protein